MRIAIPILFLLAGCNARLAATAEFGDAIRGTSTISKEIKNETSVTAVKRPDLSGGSSAPVLR